MLAGVLIGGNEGGNNLQFGYRIDRWTSESKKRRGIHVSEVNWSSVGVVAYNFSHIDDDVSL